MKGLHSNLLEIPFLACGSGLGGQAHAPLLPCRTPFVPGDRNNRSNFLLSQVSKRGISAAWLKSAQRFGESGLLWSAMDSCLPTEQLY